MGTRSGDIDPGLFGYIADRTGARRRRRHPRPSTSESGLLGLSGIEQRHAHHRRGRAPAATSAAALAIDVFCYRAGQGGRRAWSCRSGASTRSCSPAASARTTPPCAGAVIGRLGFLGLTEDAAANADHGRATGGRVSVGRRHSGGARRPDRRGAAHRPRHGPAASRSSTDDERSMTHDPAARRPTGPRRRPDQRLASAWSAPSTGEASASASSSRWPSRGARRSGHDRSTDTRVRLVTSLRAARADPRRPGRAAAQRGGRLDLILEEVVAAWQPVHDDARRSWSPRG